MRYIYISGSDPDLVDLGSKKKLITNSICISLCVSLIKTKLVHFYFYLIFKRINGLTEHIRVGS